MNAKHTPGICLQCYQSSDATYNLDQLRTVNAELLSALQEIERKTTAYINNIQQGHIPRPEYTQDIRNATALARAAIANATKEQ